MFCIKCGAKIVEGAKFCQKCGAPVDASLSATPDLSGASPAEKTDSTPPATPTTAEVPQATPAGQPGGNTQANAPAADGVPSPADPPEPISPADSGVHAPAQTAPAGGPEFTPSPVPPKKKGARWPWVVCGIGIAAVVIVVLAILGSTLGHSPASSESPEPEDLSEPSSSQVREVSLSETYTNEEEGFSFQYPSGWKPVAQEDMGKYEDLAETESTLVLLANENEDIPDANSYIMVSRYDADEGDEELLDLDDEAFWRRSRLTAPMWKLLHLPLTECRSKRSPAQLTRVICIGAPTTMRPTRGSFGWTCCVLFPNPANSFGSLTL